MLLKTSLEMLVAADEGLRLMPCRCSAGKLTIGTASDGLTVRVDKDGRPL